MFPTAHIVMIPMVSALTNLAQFLAAKDNHSCSTLKAYELKVATVRFTLELTKRSKRLVPGYYPLELLINKSAQNQRKNEDGENSDEEIVDSPYVLIRPSTSNSPEGVKLFFGSYLAVKSIGLDVIVFVPSNETISRTIDLIMEEAEQQIKRSLEALETKPELCVVRLTRKRF